MGIYEPAANQDAAEERPDTESQPQTDVPTAPLPDPIGQNIEAVTALHAKAEKNVNNHQRLVETISAFWGRPISLYVIVLVLLLWLLPNVLPRRLGVPHFDPLPFSKLELVISASALLMTSGVLIRQSRQEKLAEQRAQLNLQLSLLSEQKIAKLIALVEELRNDLPDVKNRHDPEAEVMQKAADPNAVVEELEKTLEEELAQLPKRGESSS